MDKATKIGVDNPAISPDGFHVFAQGDLINVNMCRFSFKYGKLDFEAAEVRNGFDGRYQIGDSTPDNSAGITFSQDSKFVCQVFPNGHNVKTPIYPVDAFDKHQCILEHGNEKVYPGYRALLRPLALGFDVKGGYIYTQNGGQEFMVLNLAGVIQKEYKVGFGTVKQFLVHPAGNHVVLLRGAEVGATGHQVIHSDTVLIEVPKKK